MTIDAPSLTPFELTDVPTIPAVLDTYARTLPDQVLVSTADRDITAAEFQALCGTLAAGFQSLGLPRGSAVGVLLPNGWKWLASVFGLASAGMIAVPLNTWYKDAELSSARTKAHLKAVISQDTIHGRDNAALLATAGLDRPQATPGYVGTIWWNRSSPLPTGFGGHAAPESTEPVTPTDLAMYVFTSGSSAAPKVVTLEHGNLMRNGDAMGRALDLTVGDRLWFPAPLFFGFGCTNAIMVSLTHGAAMCIEERFDPWTSARFIEERRCTVFYGRAEMIRGFQSSGALAARDLSSLKKGSIGLGAEDKRLAVEVLGLDRACSVYGLTEVYGLATMTEADDPLETVMHTQGRALPGRELRCVDVDSGAVNPGGDPEVLGEIQLRGCVTPGYLDDDTANAAAFTADGWFRTGDLGWLDHDGRLHFAGRLKEIIKVHGITVSPAEVEEFVLQHPAVEQAYAFGWPLDGTEVLSCGVVLDQPGSRAGLDVDLELRTWLKERISSYKVPARFAVLTEETLPRTGTGKVSKRLIGEKYFSAASTPA